MNSSIVIKLMTVASVVSLSNAATLRYNGGGNWDNVSNNDTGWGENPNNPPVANGSLPGPGDTARINFAGNTVIVDSDVPTTERVQIGVDESGELLIEDGGVLTTTNDVLAGNNNVAATGTLTVNSGGEVNVGRILWAAQNESTGFINIREGGVVNVASHLWWGVSGAAEITITGTLNQSGGILGLGTLNAVDPSGGTATVNVNDGGLLALNNIHASGTSIQPDSVLNINGTGQVTLPGDFLGVISEYINDGKITGNGQAGSAALEVDLTTNPGFTTITAVPVVEPNPEPLVISNLTFDDESGEISLTWNSLDSETFAIRYSLDLQDFPGDLEENYSADAGLTTTYTVNRANLLGAETAETVFFRVERVN